MEKEIKSMQEKGFKSYLKFRNLGGQNLVDFIEIKNKSGNFIGYIIYNYVKIKEENAVIKKENNALNQFNNQKNEQVNTQFKPYFKAILLALNQFENFTKIIRDFTNLNSNYKLTKHFSVLLENISNNKSVDNINVSNYISSISTGKYENIFSEIFKKLDNEFNKNKSQQNNNVQFDEMRARQFFRMEHNNPSIFENLFYIIVQKKIYCEKCNTTMYEFEYNDFLLVELNEQDNNDMMFDKLSEIKYKNEVCKKCGNNCKIEIKIEEIPQILIVIIKRKNNENFTTKNNFKIMEKNKLLYGLKCFI